MPESTEARFVLRLPVHLHERLKTAAEENNRSMNQQIVDWIEAALDGSDSATLAARIAALEREVAALRSAR